MKNVGNEPWYSYQSPFEYLRLLESQYHTEFERSHDFEQVATDLYNNIDSTTDVFLALLRSFRPQSDCLDADTSGKHKPRITVDLEMTSHCNFTLRWQPVGECMLNLDGRWAHESDFTEATHRQLNQTYFTRRPINELMFIRNFAMLHSCTSPADPVTQLLVYATRARVNQWINAVASVCSVEQRTDLDFTVENNQLLAFRIVNVAERTRQREEEWVAGFSAQWGMSFEEFVAFYVGASEYNKCAAMNEDLKKMGHKFNLRDVRRAVERIEQYHGDMIKRE